MSDLILQWELPTGRLVSVPATIVGPPGPTAGSRVQLITTADIITPNIDLYDIVDVLALDRPALIQVPQGTPSAGAPRLMFRIKDDGSSHPLSWNAAYADGGVVLPAATVAGKLMHLGFIFYPTTGKWMLIASTVEA